VRRPERLGAATARRIALGAQGLADAPSGDRPPGAIGIRQVRSTIQRLGVVQLDSVNVVARAHELTFFARLGQHDRALPWRLQDRGDLFEYWGHEASLLPVDLQPLLRWRMAEAGEAAWGSLRRLARDHPDYLEAVYDEVAARGPLRAGELSEPGARRSGSWWGWNQGKQALAFLFWTGRISATRRYPSFERRYDLPERILPAAVLTRPTPEPDDAQRALLGIAARALGVATADDLADYFRLNRPRARPLVEDLVEAGRLLPVEVEGWRPPAFLDPDARVPRRARGRALLAPFDSLIWYRDRLLRLFDVHFRIELYTPAHKRVHGYYVLPFLLGDRIVARVDLKADRKESVLRVPAAWAEPPTEPGAEPWAGGEGSPAVALHAELRRLAGWLGLERIEVGARGNLAEPLRRAGAPPAAE
jgi:uncharacterized protein YcaQ